MIASSEPIVKKGLQFFRSRLINTMVGCAIGLLFVSIGEPAPWRLPFALAITVLLSAYFVRVQVMWRQAPITAALVIAGSLTAYSKNSGIELGLTRVGEVIFGSVVGVGVSWLMAKVWSVRESGAGPDGAADQKDNPECRQDSRHSFITSHLFVGIDAITVVDIRGDRSRSTDCRPPFKQEMRRQRHLDCRRTKPRLRAKIG